MFVLGSVGHQVLLGRDYASIEPIMRSKQDMQAHMPFALIICLCFSVPWCGSIHRLGLPSRGLGKVYSSEWQLGRLQLYP